MRFANRFPRYLLVDAVRLGNGEIDRIRIEVFQRHLKEITLVLLGTHKVEFLELLQRRAYRRSGDPERVGQPLFPDMKPGARLFAAQNVYDFPGEVGSGHINAGR